MTPREQFDAALASDEKPMPLVMTTAGNMTVHIHRVTAMEHFQFFSWLFEGGRKKIFADQLVHMFWMFAVDENDARLYPDKAEVEKLKIRKGGAAKLREFHDACQRLNLLYETPDEIAVARQAVKNTEVNALAANIYENVIRRLAVARGIVDLESVLEEFADVRQLRDWAVWEARQPDLTGKLEAILKELQKTK